ncbi:hypothetical protein [Flagellimonas sp. CMM7]|uniref:hypothetical protein n=1 Tax=Flagellimonas sp. CMM7 TaxID=2654676 RepID=UPI0013D6AD6E|nr:hypothetical protein [Flagellimonas sp. CMM7]UII78585.1 hypothetical protein LV704_13025 [Flagellimonas sp. CMM7]
MPARENNLSEYKHDVSFMLRDTLESFQLISDNLSTIFGSNIISIKRAVDETLKDFDEVERPFEVIQNSSLSEFQRAGFYGAQLRLKRDLVSNANERLRATLSSIDISIFRPVFIKWVDIINNFLGSLSSAFGIAEALKELKDCLRDSLP